MKNGFLRLSVLWLFLICCSGRAAAEIIVGNSIEWLTVSSRIVAAGKIVGVEKSKGEGSVIYETYVFEPSEIIKGPKQKLAFTIRTFSTAPVFGKSIEKTDKILVFLSENEDSGETFLRGKLVPTSAQFPLSIIASDRPGKFMIDLDFRVLKNKADILEICRRAVKAQAAYQKQNPAGKIKRFYLEIPMATEAFGSLFGGSDCYLFVPNFMSPKAKETIF